MARPDGRVELGKIVGVWGVRGYLKIYSYTRDSEGIAQYSTWTLVSGQGEADYHVTECRKQGRGLVARLEGIEERNEAEKLVGSRVFVSQADLPELPAGEYYWHQLIGLQVLDLQGNPLGKVDHLLETGANDVLVVSDGKLQRLIPYIPDTVKDIDLSAGTLGVDWTAGWDEGD